MCKLSKLHHQQSTRHFSKKKQLHQQRPPWHLFAYKLLCCLQLQRQRIGLHPGWLWRSMKLWNWFHHHLGLENGDGAFNIDPTKTWPFVSESYVPGIVSAGRVLKSSWRVIPVIYVKANGCWNGWMLLFPKVVESPIYKRKPYSVIGRNKATQWAVCVLGVLSSLPAAGNSPPRKVDNNLVNKTWQVLGTAPFAFALVGATSTYFYNTIIPRVKSPCFLHGAVFLTFPLKQIDRIIALPRSPVKFFSPRIWG